MLQFYLLLAKKKQQQESCKIEYNCYIVVVNVFKYISKCYLKYIKLISIFNFNFKQQIPKGQKIIYEPTFLMRYKY